MYVTKQVQLSDDAYASLRSAKHKGESFSDTVLRLTRKGSILSIVGLRSKADVEAHRRMIAEVDRLDRAPRVRRGSA